MDMRGRVRNAKAHRDFVQEQRLALATPGGAQIIAREKDELINPRRQGRAFQKRGVGAAIGIGDHLFHFAVALPRKAVKRDLHPGSGRAACSVQDMRRQAAHWRSPSSLGVKKN